MLEQIALNVVQHGGHYDISGDETVALAQAYLAARAEVARLRAALESARAWTEAYRPLSELRALIDAALAGPHDNTPAVTVQGLP